jgi:uncharacterized membrane protein YccC
MPGASHLKQRYPSIVMPFVPPEGDEQRIRQEGNRYFRFYTHLTRNGMRTGLSGIIGSLMVLR